MNAVSEPASFARSLPEIFAQKREEALPLAFAWLEIHDLLPPKRFLPDVAPHMNAGVLRRQDYRELQGGICPYCLDPLPQKMRPPKKARPLKSLPLAVRRKVIATLRRTVTRDHIDSRCRGGPDMVFNIVAVHGRCNGAKAEIPLIMYMWAKATGKLSFVQRAYENKAFKVQAMKTRQNPVQQAVRVA
jgi:hypothetical protein